MFGFRKECKKQNGQDWVTREALKEALRELEEEREKNETLRKDLKIFDEENKNLMNNLEVLQNTVENIRKLCKDKNGRVISSLTILKELGE